MVSCWHPKRMGSWIFWDRGLSDEGCFYIAHEHWSPRSVRKLVSLGEAELGLCCRTRNKHVCPVCVLVSANVVSTGQSSQE